MRRVRRSVKVAASNRPETMQSGRMCGSMDRPGWRAVLAAASDFRSATAGYAAGGIQGEPVGAGCPGVEPGNPGNARRGLGSSSSKRSERGDDVGEQAIQAVAQGLSAGDDAQRDDGSQDAVLDGRDAVF